MIGTLPSKPPKQHPLLRLSPIPKRASERLPRLARLARAWASQMVECGMWNDERAARILPTIQSMRLDDALYWRDWRLELVWLNKGYPHYRLYWLKRRHYVFGQADIRLDNSEGIELNGKGEIEVKIRYGADIQRSPQLRVVQRRLAAYCVACGAAPDDMVLVKGDARTKLCADTSRVYRLFKVRG